MAKSLKKMMAQELRKNLEKVDSFVVFGYEKMNTLQTYSFRKELRALNIRIKVVRNRTAIHTFNSIYQIDMKTMLKGPSAIAYGGNSPVDIAKALVDWNKKNNLLQIKGAYIPNKILSTKDVLELAKVPPRETLLSMLAGSFQGMLQQTAIALNAPLQSVACAMQAQSEKVKES